MKEFDEFEGYEEERGESIDLKPYIQKALKKWKTIVLFAVIGAVLGGVIGISTPKTFTSRAVVAPELVTRATSGGISSLASLAGINMNTMALTDAMHPDMYPVIIHSTSFYVSLFDVPVTVADKDSLVHTDLYDYMANYYKRPWYGYVLGLPRLAIAGLKGVLSKKKDLEEPEGHENVDTLRLTRQQERVVKMLARSVSASVEKRTYVLSLQVTMQDPVIAATVANAIIDNLRSFVVSYRTEKSRENMEYYKKIYEITRDEYLAAQRAYAYYVDTHQSLTSKSTMVYQQQLQNEAQLRYSMYSQTAQNLLNAEAKVQQEAPVLVVIQPGIAPHIGKPSTMKLIVIWLLLGGIAGVALALFGPEKKTKEED